MQSLVDGLFFEVISEIKRNYPDFGFYMERDLVWTIQKMLLHRITKNNLPYNVYNDYPIEKGERRSKSVDLAVVGRGIDYHDILDQKVSAELVVEFKFEPSRMRKDICTHRLPVVFWSEVVEDINRVKRFFSHNKAKSAIAVFIDEYGRNRNKSSDIFEVPNMWEEWGSYNTSMYNISVLITAMRNIWE